MKNTRAKQLGQAAKAANQQLSKLTPNQKSDLEKSWDIEHAYYSSALEGSKLDRKEFDHLAKDVK